jgi:LuxR family maltose regulon positive regulatory protein
MAEIGGIRRVKLTPPMPPSDAVRRSALIERLDRAAGLPLITVTAPAGYGKTTLMATWARSGRRRIAWLSLDAADGDLRRFAAYMVAAIRTVEPDAAPSMDALLGGRRDLDATAIAEVLADDLVGLRGDLTLILDDLHSVHDPAPAAMIDALLRYPPPRFHLAIASREQPSGPNVQRLWSRGQNLRLTDADLRFGPGEIANMLGKGGADRVAAVEAATDGWPAGVRAASFSGAASGPPGAASEVRSYLIEDALAGHPPEAIALLRAAAVVERLCPDLAVALAGEQWTPGSVRALLEQFVAARFFTTRIDGEWIRIHPVLRDALVADLAEREGLPAVQRQHQRASLWFAAAGMAAEAVDHALNAGSVEEAASLIDAQAAAWLAQDQIVRSGGFIGRLPEEVVRTWPGLLLMRAHVSVLLGRLADSPPDVNAAERLLDARAGMGDPHRDDAALRIEIAGLRCVAAYHQGDPRPARHLAEGLLSVDASRHPLVFSQAVVAYVHAMALEGRAGEALARLQELAAAEQPGPDARAGALAIGCFHLASALGDEAASVRWAEQALRHAPPEMPRLHLTAAVMQFGALFELGDIVGCEAALALADSLDRSSNLLVVSALHVLKGQFLAERGRIDEARQVVREARRMADLADLRPMLEVCDALAASIALEAGEIEVAGRWADLAEPAWRPMMAHQTEPPPIVRARIFLARQAPGDLARAEAASRAAIAHAEEVHQALPRLRALPILAVALAAQGDEAGALDAMRAALAWPRGMIIRRFSVLGDPARVLLERLAVSSDDPAAAAARRALAAWPVDAPDAADRAAPIAGSAASDLTSLISRLSNRELDVLRLMARRMSNKEIAAELRISPDTVKEYSSALYRKLGVSSRHQAVDLLRAVPEFA